MRYYISDCHFFHRDLLTKMDCRGFKSVEEMNEYMIYKWNKKVRPNDEVVILGDFSMGNASETNDVLNRLNGHLFLIIGNHDRFPTSKDYNSSRFEWLKYYAELSDNKRKVICSHYPIFCYNGQYRYDEFDKPKTYMLYGHVHNTFDELLVHRFQEITRNSMRLTIGGQMRHIPCQMINCFCMFSDYTPLTLDEWIVVDRERRKKISVNL